MTPRIRVLDIGQDKPVLVIDRSGPDFQDMVYQPPTWCVGVLVFPFEVDIEGVEDTSEAAESLVRTIVDGVDAIIQQRLNTTHVINVATTDGVAQQLDDYHQDAVRRSTHV